ncbi:BatA domain-containing protein [Paludisphaera mucosa]|uniref:BatA domain-containing protein n=1 Tax=Paludisphaera mucosa TaxID=3030827 RepID=A0ABT6FL26_9BACT|nr:BatA domain-containing protein [Paludisphaera mucosa]MDG3008270.1 BatA domain-containing protein [Paludisphaera mucosa]
MTFLSPLLIWGALLGAIPIIIHLLNRRRFRRVEWAPMKYLKLTIQRNRRRIQLEELLLLLLRVALPVVLFFFLARPVLNPTGMERWLGRGGRSSEVVLIDDSLSMGYASSEGAAFQKAVQVATTLLGSTPPNDRCTLATTSAPTAPVVHDVEAGRREELAAAVAGLSPTATHAAWPTVLAGIDDVLKSCTYPTRRLTILTDLRRSGWDGTVGEIAKRWGDEAVVVRIVDVGAVETANVALQSLAPLERTVLAGAPSAWEAVVRNDSPRSIVAAKAILRVDDKPSEVPLPELAPGATVRLPLSVSFPGSGPHEFSLQLPDDELPADGRRWASVPVKDSLLIRLVDGEPSAEPFASEVDYLAAPLSIGVGSAEAWRIEVVPDQDFLSQRLETPDVLVLANVAAPTPEQATRLRRLVREGMGLMIFAGARVDLGLYNDLLFRPDDRILPFALKATSDQPFRGLFIEPVRPSPLEKLLELKASAFERVPVRWITTVDEGTATSGESKEKDEARVLARWNDPDRSPAVAERVVGEGRVLLWTTTADRTGNDWPVEPSFVLAIREAVKGVARATSTANTIAAGDPILRIVHSSHEVTNARLTPPGGTEPLSLAAVPMPDDPTDDRGPGFSIDLPDTRRAGVYRLSWEEGPLGAREDVFAANPDPRESQLERIESGEVKKLLEPLNVEVVAARGDVESFAATGREIWRDLAAALLVLLVAEAAFAAWVGRSR